MKEKKPMRLKTRILTSLLVALAVPVKAQTCTKPITAVPCTITTQGYYSVTGDAFDRLEYNTMTGAAITVSAASVVIDLGRVKLSGNSNTDNEAIGIKATNAVNLVVRGGSIRRFYKAIEVDGTSKAVVVEDVLIDFVHGVGISLSADAGVVRRCRVVDFGGSTISDQAKGIVLSGVGNIALQNDVANQALPTAPATATGIEVQGGDAIVEGNRLTKLDVGVAYLSGTSGKYRDNTTSGVTANFSGSGTDAGGNN